MAEGIYCFQKSRFHSLFFLHPHPDAYGEIALELGGCSSINWLQGRIGVLFFFFWMGGGGNIPRPDLYCTKQQHFWLSSA